MSVRGSIIRQARHLMDSTSDLGAVWYSASWTTWGEISRLAAAIERACTELGLSPDAPIALVVRNRPNAMAAMLGAIANRRHPVMVSASQPPQFVRDIATRLGVAAVVLDEEARAAGLAERLPDAGISTIVMPRPDDDDFVAVTTIPATSDPAPAIAPVDLNTAFSVLTSGTTGLPKPVAVQWQSIPLDYARVPMDPSDPQRRPPIIHALALSTITGARGVLGAALKGRAVAMLDRVEVDEWSKLVQRFKVRRAGMPPAAMRMMLEQKIPRTRLESLEAWPTGSAPVDPGLQREFEEFYGVPVLVSYGSSEIGGAATGWTLELHRAWIDSKLGSVGRAREGFELRTVDPDIGLQVATGEVGVLEVRHSGAGGTASRQWLRTSDMARIDEDGFVFIIGRIDDVINRGGNKISLGELEGVARSHEEVRDAGAVDVPDARLGQVPVLGVVLKSGSMLAPTQLSDWIRERVVAYKVPREVRILDQLPMGASHKVDRAKLRKEFTQ